MLCVRWLVLAAAAAAALCGGARAQHPAPACPRDHAHSCVLNRHNDNNYEFKVNGIDITYELQHGFTMTCRHVALDEPALPRFEPALRVREVLLLNCWPRTTSYAAALRALNVIGLNALGPGDAQLPTYHIELDFSKIKNFDINLLAAMPTLRVLRFYKMNITITDLTLLPAGLETLKLLDTRINYMPATALEHLPHLGELEVSGMEPVVLEAIGNQKVVRICSSATTLVNESLPDTLKQLSLCYWTLRQPWPSCAGLDKLEIISANKKVDWNSNLPLTIPDDWLARCAQLRILWVQDTFKLRLRVGALRGAAALEEVRFVKCELEALPVGLLDDAHALRLLDLDSNRLHTVPSELFRHCQFLSELRFDDNPELDGCPPARASEHTNTRGLSSLRNLTNLTVLSLAGTATRRVCADWRQLPRLQEIDLTDTAITHLNYTDMQFISTVNITVPSVNISLRREDYKSASAAPAPAGPTLTLRLSEPLLCDCGLYWAAAAMRLNGTRKDARCTNGRLLRDMSLDELVCTPPGRCPEGCACVARNDTARPGPVLLLSCARARLRSVPRVHTRDTLRYEGAEPVELDLNLTNNRIDRLAPEDLPPELTVLDLRNNVLAVIDAATAAALVSRADRRVWLAGNPLDCSCRSAGAALAAMRAHPAVFLDWADIICYDGIRTLSLGELFCDVGTTLGPRNMTQIVPNNSMEGVLQYTTPTSPRSVPGDRTMSLTLAFGGVAVGAVVTTALGWVALRRHLRRAPPVRTPSILQLEDRQPESSGGWAYDAFVSFAHADEAIAHELVERLEEGTEPLRLCVHYRDWMPGGWIPTQIAASVRVSRRTVALVSEAFLRSKWARAEFREAYAAALEETEPRLVLVLLEDPARLLVDSELAAYVSGITYVRWGDPWFWQKLRRALWRPMARPGLTPLPPLGTTITTRHDTTRV